MCDDFDVYEPYKNGVKQGLLHVWQFPPRNMCDSIALLFLKNGLIFAE